MSLFQRSSCTFGKRAWDSKGASDCASLGGLRRRAVSEAHAVERKLELELEFKDFESKEKILNIKNRRKFEFKKKKFEIKKREEI